MSDASFVKVLRQIVAPQRGGGGSDKKRRKFNSDVHTEIITLDSQAPIVTEDDIIFIHKTTKDELPIHASFKVHRADRVIINVTLVETNKMEGVAVGRKDFTLEELPNVMMSLDFNKSGISGITLDLVCLKTSERNIYNNNLPDGYCVDLLSYILVKGYEVAVNLLWKTDPWSKNFWNRRGVKLSVYVSSITEKSKFCYINFFKALGGEEIVDTVVDDHGKYYSGNIECETHGIDVHNFLHEWKQGSSEKIQRISVGQ
jgi:hypothetical protein